MRRRRLNRRRLIAALPRCKRADRLGGSRRSGWFGVTVRADAEDVPVGHGVRQLTGHRFDARRRTYTATAAAMTTAAATPMAVLAFGNAVRRIERRLHEFFFFVLIVDLCGGAFGRKSDALQHLIRAGATPSAAAATTALAVSAFLEFARSFVLVDDDGTGLVCRSRFL